MNQEPSDRYSKLTIALHWLMAVLLVAVYACIELREFFPKGSDPREALKVWHFMLGLCVLFLVVLRMAARMAGSTPPIDPAPPKWQKIVASHLHWVLYIFMIGMPLGGWLILSASGKPIPFFGMELPALIGANKGLAKSIKELHETVGQVGYFLIGLHVAAGLYHHYFVRDNALKRMLPWQN